MARAHFVKKARKAIKSIGLKKGESYYWWKFRFGGKHVSKTAPRRSQLTQSSFLSSMYDAEDSLADSLSSFVNEDAHSFEDLATACEDSAASVRDAGDECESNRSNMPDSLQDSDTGQLLEQRKESCDTIADELEQCATDIRALDADDEGRTADDKQAAIDEASNLIEQIGWNYE